jgi:hypothetical protein
VNVACCCISVGGSTYLRGTALLTGFFCEVHGNMKIVEKLVYLVLLKVGKMGADLYTSVQSA